ncbi:hypothetical protein SHAM105786_09500 [Shewanella amazonensis]
MGLRGQDATFAGRANQRRHSEGLMASCASWAGVAVIHILLTHILR